MARPKRIRRGASNRQDSEFVGAWLEKSTVKKLDELVMIEDSDRSKILRRALRTAIASALGEAA